jgi:hypothetical protein
MKSSNKIRPSEAVRLDISRLNPDARLTYGRHMAAQKRHAVLSEMCIAQLTAHRGGETLDAPQNLGSLTMSWIQSEHGKEIAASAALVAVLESCEAYAEAQEKLIPLLDELAASEQAEAVHIAKVNAARIKQEEAKKKAMADAVKKVEAEFAPS